MEKFLCRAMSRRSSSSSRSSSSTSETPESSKPVNTQEITIKNFQESMDNWKIPKVQRTQVYQNAKFNLFTTDFVVKTSEHEIQLSKPFESIQLLSEKSLQKHRKRGYKYIHVGLIQVGFKPLTKEGLNTSILAVLRDLRFNQFYDSLLGTVESSLFAGPISFDCYPNLTLSLNDPTILTAVTLQIKTHNYDTNPTMRPIAIMYRIYYKALISAFIPTKHIFHSKKGETLFLQTDITKANTTVPQTIKWKDITLPENWNLLGAVPTRDEPEPEPENISNKPNAQLSQIQQYSDGSVTLTFNRSQSVRLTDDTSSKTSVEDLGRVSQLGRTSSQLPSVINLPYTSSQTQNQFYNPRFSTSDLHNSSLKNVDYSTKIPHPIYIRQPGEGSSNQAQRTESPPTSPTFSAMTENTAMAHELNVLSTPFELNKTLLHNDFYASYNTEKRLWFFKRFINQRKEIQNEFYNFISENQVHILFFDWFELYASQNNVYYPFKSSNPITKNKAREWETLQGERIESVHPPLRAFKIPYGDQTVEATPYKNPKDDILSNSKNIILQNNFTNTSLNTLGKQLTKIETHLQTLPLVTHATNNKQTTLKLEGSKLKTPIFKPFQISKTSQKELNKSEFQQAIREQLSKLEGTSSSLIAPDTPQTLHILEQNSDSENSVHEPIEINRLHWSNPITKFSSPDLGIENKPFILNQTKFNASSVYEWNIDGLTEYNILSLLHQMTMTANVYKTQASTSDKAIAELIIAGFSGQLKGWWDYHLTEQERSEILQSFQIHEDGTPIYDEEGNTIPDAVSTLIFSISLHFIGDSSHLKDKNAELLSNLRCKKLSDFQWYKNTFLTRVMLREDSNQSFWKEKFLAGLPTLLGERVRNTIRKERGNKIPYESLTYGELISFTQKEGLQICQDLKLQKHLKWELRKTKQELGSFCKQFDLGFSKSPSDCNGKCSLKSSKRKPEFRKRKNFSKPFPKKKPYKSYHKKHNKDFHKKSVFKDITCYKCGKKGHTSKYCRLNTKLNELQLEEQTLQKIQELMIDSSNSESENDCDLSTESENDFQLDEIATSSSSESLQINVLTKDQELLLDVLKRIESPDLQKEYLEKLLKTFEQKPNAKSPSLPTSSYDLTTILNKRKSKQESKMTIQDLHLEIKTIKAEIKELKEKQLQDSSSIQLLLQSHLQNESSEEDEPPETSGLQNLENIPEDFLFVLKQITSRKYLIEITLEFSNEFKINTIALFDTGADLNCIKSGLIPVRFLETTKEKLAAANNSKLRIKHKTDAYIVNDEFNIKTSFVEVEDIRHTVILGTPFINLITPYTVTQNGIQFSVKTQKLIFPFIEKPKTRDLNIIKACSIYKNELNVLTQAKEAQLSFLQKDLNLQKIENNLQDVSIKTKISNLQHLFEKDLCADIPNAFWERKQHLVNLPYEPDFSEKLIPTKARPIQMNHELEQHCKKEIQDLEQKKLIRKSRSPWSCAAFYVNKNSEIERGTPRLVINYKPLNKALRWIRYPIPNKKDLLQKLHSAFIFSKFDMKSGFWQIQIDPQDRYKTAFAVPFGQYEWNVMPFGLKNAPSEFQRIMNEIFNDYSEFCIVYIDDVLVFSKSIEQHFKHLKTFFYVIKKNGLVLSKTKMSFFQTKIRFLGHYIQQGTIIPIERSVAFAEKFPDQILDKTQLQRFLGSLNYVLDFCPNINRLAKPLHDRLKKNPVPWSHEHTSIVKYIKKQVVSIPCLHLPDPLLPKIVETDASDIGYGGILKQKRNQHEHIIQFTSGHWNDCQKNYSTIKKEILSIVLCITKFQSDLLNQKFLLRIDCKSAKEILQKDVQNIASKHIFARWQAILSIFDFDIEYIKGDTNSLPDFLTREFLQNRPNTASSNATKKG